MRSLVHGAVFVPAAILALGSHQCRRAPGLRRQRPAAAPPGRPPHPPASTTGPPDSCCHSHLTQMALSQLAAATLT